MSARLAWLIGGGVASVGLLWLIVAGHEFLALWLMVAGMIALFKWGPE